MKYLLYIISMIFVYSIDTASTEKLSAKDVTPYIEEAVMRIKRAMGTSHVSTGDVEHLTDALDSLECFEGSLPPTAKESYNPPTTSTRYAPSTTGQTAPSVSTSNVTRFVFRGGGKLCVKNNMLPQLGIPQNLIGGEIELYGVVPDKESDPIIRKLKNISFTEHKEACLLRQSDLDDWSIQTWYNKFMEAAKDK